MKKVPLSCKTLPVMLCLFQICRYTSSCWLQLVLAALSALSQAHGLGVQEKFLRQTVSIDTFIKSYNGHILYLWRIKTNKRCFYDHYWLTTVWGDSRRWCALLSSIRLHPHGVATIESCLTWWTPQTLYAHCRWFWKYEHQRFIQKSIFALFKNTVRTEPGEEAFRLTNRGSSGCIPT